MAERPEDLNLPITVVQRLVKDALPDGVIVSKEARHTISRASSVFVLYLTACAVAHADKAKRKTLAVNDILSACGDMEFDSFVPLLKDSLNHRKEFLAQNAKTKPSKTVKKAEEVEDEEVEVDEPEVVEAPELEEEEENDVGENGNDSKSNDHESLSFEGKNKKRKLTDTEQEVEVKKIEEDNDEIEVDDESSDSENESNNEEPL